MTEPTVPPQPPVPPAGATAVQPTVHPAVQPTGQPAGPAVQTAGPAVPPAAAGEPLPAGQLATGPVSGRPPAPPAPAHRRRTGPMTRMGPWAPVAGAALGLVAGLVAALLLAGRAEAFAEELSLVLLVVGLTLLGASGVLLADEVRLVRRGTRDAGVRPSWVEATAGLVNGLTPARLLLAAAAFVLFLAAYTGR
ncbi:hypothetical protein ACI780_13505 [Geodermatophilus sp. SYSU D00814]